MKSNEQLQKEVQDAIKWEPLLHAAEIGVTVDNGVVTLSGHVNSYTKKVQAEHAVRNVAGVNALIEKIEVKFDSSDVKGDEEIAREILSAFKWNWKVPNDSIRVKVEKGWVSLDGDVSWQYQRQAAKDSIEDLQGIKGVINNIKIKSEHKDQIEKKGIEDAIARSWSLNDCDIHVEAHSNRITLSGTVNSYYQKMEAERIAWNAPGVSFVDNSLIIQYSYLLVE